MMTTAEQLVLVNDADKVRTITLNRPDRLNAFSVGLMRAMQVAFEEARDDDSVHAVILTGAGRAFSAGADLEEMGQANDKRASGEYTEDEDFFRLQEILEVFPKPIIAAVNGVGVGFGFTVLGYCDFVYFGESGRVRAPFSQLGLSPEGSSSYIFPMRMGWSNAARALMLGDWFTAQDMLACGFANKVVPDVELLAETQAFAARFGRSALQSLKATKALMLQAHERNIIDIRVAENKMLASLIGSPANLAAIEAFNTRKS